MNKIKTAGAVIFAILMLLIFFSSTIYNYNIPEVTAVLPTNAKLNKSESSSGITSWADTYEMYFEAGGRIDELFVSEGDYVEAGQPMARLSFDVDELELKLGQLRVEQGKTRLAIETSRLKIERLQEQITELLEESYEPDEVSDYGIVVLEAKIERAREAHAKALGRYSQLSLLYEVGAVARQELDSGELELKGAEFELNSLVLEHENARRLKSESEEQSAKAVEDKEKSRARQVSDWRYEIDTLQRDIETKLLDIERSIAEQNSAERLLQSYSDNLEIYAPRAAQVAQMTVKAGQAVSKNQFFASLGLGSTFELKCDVSLKNNFVVVGDECRISNNDHAFVAVVTKVTPTDRAKEVTVTITSEEITPGETFEVEFGKQAAQSAVLVQNGAVNKDSDGYFVYYIKKRDGILGEEYYAEKVSVYIGDSDNENTVITRGITFFEPIILLADKPFSDGETIKVRNEGDFFVD